MKIIMRIPRKKKKFYKKLWEARLGYKFIVDKSSIEKDTIWGCLIYPYKK